MSAHEHSHHVTSLATLMATFAALIALTVLTVAMAQVPLGRLDIWVTLGIATLKAGLVALIFMHLRNDKAINGLILLFTLGFAALFICFALMDSTNYQDQIREFEADQAAVSS
ncbi:MAG: cytochrome C oxidase subunit IV family protein [Planctomycetota bacterium]